MKLFSICRAQHNYFKKVIQLIVKKKITLRALHSPRALVQSTRTLICLLRAKFLVYHPPLHIFPVSPFYSGLYCAHVHSWPFTFYFVRLFLGYLKSAHLPMLCPVPAAVCVFLRLDLVRCERVPEKYIPCIQHTYYSQCKLNAKLFQLQCPTNRTLSC